MTEVRSQWVINFDHEADIQVIAGDLDLSMLKTRLSHTYERYLATLFFNRRSEKLAAASKEILSVWYFRAALSQFQGTIELVLHDIPSDRKQIWKRSEIKANLDSHPLIATMSRVRNLALHTGKLLSPLQDRTITFIPGGEREVTELILGPIAAAHVQDTDLPPPESLKWFNRQATFWSANALLTESSFVLMVALDNFVRMNEKHIGQQKEALDRMRLAEHALSYE
jgi:hypothetical protein